MAEKKRKDYDGERFVTEGDNYSGSIYVQKDVHIKGNNDSLDIMARDGDITIEGNSKSWDIRATKHTVTIKGNVESAVWIVADTIIIEGNLIKGTVLAKKKAIIKGTAYEGTIVKATEIDVHERHPKAQIIKT